MQATFHPSIYLKASISFKNSLFNNILKKDLLFIYVHVCVSVCACMRVCVCVRALVQVPKEARRWHQVSWSGEVDAGNWTFNCWAREYIGKLCILEAMVWLAPGEPSGEELKEAWTLATLWNRFNWHCLSHPASPQLCWLTGCRRQGLVRAGWGLCPLCFPCQSAGLWSLHEACTFFRFPPPHLGSLPKRPSSSSWPHLPMSPGCPDFKRRLCEAK